MNDTLVYLVVIVILINTKLFKDMVEDVVYGIYNLVEKIYNKTRKK